MGAFTAMIPAIVSLVPQRLMLSAFTPANVNEIREMAAVITKTPEHSSSIRPTFLVQGTCMPQSRGMGMTRTMASVSTFSTVVT